MIWLLLAGFIFVLLLDSYSDGDFDWLIDWVKRLLKKLRLGWLKSKTNRLKHTVNRLGSIFYCLLIASSSYYKDIREIKNALNIL